MSEQNAFDEAKAGAFAERLFGAGIAAGELATVYVGDQLGLYRSLSDSGPATFGELARRSGIHPRYAQEWLEQQAAAGILKVDDAAAPAERRRYTLPPEHAAGLVDRDSPFSIAFQWPPSPRSGATATLYARRISNNLSPTRPTILFCSSRPADFDGALRALGLDFAHWILRCGWRGGCRCLRGSL